METVNTRWVQRTGAEIDWPNAKPDVCVCAPAQFFSSPSLSPCPLLLLNETGSHDATLAALNSHSVARLAFKTLGSRHSLLSGGMLPRSAATFFSIQTQLKVSVTKGWRVSVGCSLSIFWKQSLSSPRVYWYRMTHWLIFRCKAAPPSWSKSLSVNGTGFGWLGGAWSGLHLYSQGVSIRHFLVMFFVWFLHWVTVTLETEPGIILLCLQNEFVKACH